MKKFLIALVFFSIQQIHAQVVKVLYKSDLNNLSEGKKFAFIESTIDTSQIQYVATILSKDKSRKARYGGSLIESLYIEIRKQANKLGANCYKIKTFARDTLKHETVLILDSYFASDTILNINTTNHEKNVIFIFGEETEDQETMSFNLNDVKKEIKGGTYYKINLKEGEEIKVSRKGAGAPMWLKWEPNKRLAFYTLTGIGDIQTIPVNSPSGNGFTTIATNKINSISDISFGLLLVHLLKQSN
jgi:hypothetical protein